MRSTLLIAGSICTLCLGCASPPDGPEVGLKEVYIEAQRGSALVFTKPFPLETTTEDQAYSAVRGFVLGREEARRMYEEARDKYPRELLALVGL